MAKRKDKQPPQPPPTEPAPPDEDDFAVPATFEVAPSIPPVLGTGPADQDEIPTARVETTGIKREVEKTRAARFGIRGLGWKADPRDVRDYSARALFGARRGLPGAASLEGYVSAVRDQLTTSSCVGQAIARAVDTRLRAIGITTTYPSALAAYSFARALGRLSPSEALTDDGSQPRLAMKGIRDWGLPPETKWPFDEAHVNDELPLDVMQSASGFKLAAWHRVDTIGRERVLDVCQAISNKYPVVLGVDADRALMTYTKGQVLTTPVESEVVGGHMLCLVGYRTTSSGQMQLRGVNSWGTGWGERGFFWADETWLTAPGTGDIYVLVVQGA